MLCRPQKSSRLTVHLRWCSWKDRTFGCCRPWYCSKLGKMRWPPSDAIRADLASRARTEPGEREASGVFDDKLGNEEAAGLFFIERNGLVRLVVSGPGREDRLSDLAELARDKLADG